MWIWSVTSFECIYWEWVWHVLGRVSDLLTDHFYLHRQNCSPSPKADCRAILFAVVCLHLLSHSLLPPFTSFALMPACLSVCSPAAAHLALSLLVSPALSSAVQLSSVCIWACAHAVALCRPSLAPVHYHLQHLQPPNIYTQYHLIKKSFRATFTQIQIIFEIYFVMCISLTYWKNKTKFCIVLFFKKYFQVH